MRKKERTVDEWGSELEEAMDYRVNYGLCDLWPELESIFQNVHPSAATAGPNIVLSTGDAMLSSLNVPNPAIDIIARSVDAVSKVNVLRSLDNSLLRALRVREEFEQASLHAYLWGRGFLKVGYDSEFGYNPGLDPMRGLGGFTFSMFDKRGQRIEFGKAKPGMPWVKCVLPHDILVPKGTGRDLSSAEWVAHRVVRNVMDVRADKKYSNTMNLKGNMSSEDMLAFYEKPTSGWKWEQLISRPALSSEEQFVELWEIHDQRTGKIYVVASGHKSFLRNEVDLMQVHGLPFVSFSFTPSTRSFWGPSDAFYLLWAQNELADIHIQSSKHRRISIMKFLVEKGLLTQENKNDLMSSEIGPYIEVNSGGRDLRNAVATFQPQQSSQTYQEAEVTRRNAREVVGYSRNQIGEYEQTGRRTATEAGIVSQASSLRMDRRQAVIGSSYERLFEIINSLIVSYWKTPRIQQTLNKDGQEQYVQFVGSDLRGEFDYSVHFTVEKRLDPQTRAQRAMSIYSAFAQDPSVDPARLRQFLISEMDDPAVSNIFPPELRGAANANVQPQVPPMQAG